MTADQYRHMYVLQRLLVRYGVHPAVAGGIVRRAAKQVLARESGVGKVHQVRRVQRERTGIPRPVIRGEECRHIQEVPGEESAMWREINDLRRRGWTISSVGRSKGYPAVATYYACPPGRMSREAQPLMLHARFA